MMKALGDKHQILSQTPEIEAKRSEAPQPVIDGWLETTPAGDKVFAVFPTETSKVKAGQ